MTARFPWGSGPAPAHDCHECGKHIGNRRFHCIVDNTRVLCGRCLDQRHLHTKYYPECPDAWHDMYDHDLKLATRAAAWFVLNDPEKRTCA
jgi:hypothetical protein